jgi:uncharacterized protein (DUF1778 family)
MVAQNAVADEEHEIEEPPQRIVLSPEDAKAILEAMARPPQVNEKTLEQLRKNREFRKRHRVESVS